MYGCVYVCVPVCVCVCVCVCMQDRAGSASSISLRLTVHMCVCVCVCRAELDQQAAEVERQRHQLTGAARTQAQLSQLESELARREQDLKVACASCWTAIGRNKKEFTKLQPANETGHLCPSCNIVMTSVHAALSQHSTHCHLTFF